MDGIKVGPSLAGLQMKTGAPTRAGVFIQLETLQILSQKTEFCTD